jgi:hypothetical protein
MNQLLVQVEEGGPRPCGVGGKVQLKCGDGRSCYFGCCGARPFQNGEPLLLT